MLASACPENLYYMTADDYEYTYTYVRYNSQEENKRLEAVSLCVYSILNLFNSSIYYGACQNNDHMRR